MSADNNKNLNQVIALCRPGFENDCANELMDYARQKQFSAYIKAKANAGYIQLVSTGASSDAFGFMQNIIFDQLIFTRQWFASPSEMLVLPEQDRITTILKAIDLHALTFDAIELSYADTNTGKSLSKFCKQFLPHLERALKPVITKNKDNKNKLNILFMDSTHVFTGLCDIHNSASVEMGIPRLRMPSSAPSRSTLKLEEAIMTFLSSDQQEQLIRPGMRAVDLGAAPGGWTWQLVKRQLFVTAIDNGPMDKDLINSGMVEHLRTDAFNYSQKKVDWLVCDMVEQPHRVSKLIAKWFRQRWCQHAIFNLKLPMNKRYESVKQCKKILSDTLDELDIEYRLQIKQLYHDREEVTVCIITDT